MNDTHKAQPFDEQAALAELERLADKIQATRRQRADTVAEFETFVKTFRQDRYQELISQHETELQHEVRTQARPVRPIGEVAANLGIRAPMPPAAAAPPAAASSPAAASALPAAAPPSPEPAEPVAATYKPTAIAVALSPPAVAPADADHPSGIGDFKPEPLPPPVVAPVSASASSSDRAAAAALRSRLPLAAAAAAVVLIAAAFWMFGGSSESPGAAATPAVTSATAPAAAPAPAGESPAAAPPSPKPVPIKALNIELVTVKPVWLRVTVDGTRAIEAELPPDRRLPFAADKLIQIRAGNGGAVKLMVAGEDRGLLGADGRVVDRQLTPTPR